MNPKKKQQQKKNETNKQQKYIYEDKKSPYSEPFKSETTITGRVERIVEERGSWKTSNNRRRCATIPSVRVCTSTDGICRSACSIPVGSSSSLSDSPSSLRRRVHERARAHAHSAATCRNPVVSAGALRPLCGRCPARRRPDESQRPRDSPAFLLSLSLPSSRTAM